MTETLSTDEIRALYATPAISRPWVRAVFVSTLDGSAVDADGLSGSLGGEVDSVAFAALRELADVVLVGAGTAREEEYGPITGHEDGRSTPLLALASRRLDIPRRVQTEGTIVVTTTEALAEGGDRLDGAVEVIARGVTEVDWPAVLEEFGERGLRSVTCEGGPHLLGSLLEADVVDELCLTLDPGLIAGHGTRIAVSPSPTRRSMELAHAHPVGDVLLLRYLRRRHY